MESQAWGLAVGPHVQTNETEPWKPYGSRPRTSLRSVCVWTWLNARNMGWPTASLSGLPLVHDHGCNGTTNGDDDHRENHPCPAGEATSALA